MIALLYLFPLAAGLLGCAPRTEPPDSVAPDTAAGAEGEAAAITGVVRVVGSAPLNVQTVIVTDVGSVRVSGPLSEELTRLAGARVLARGEVGAAPDPIVDREIVAESYEILTVDGRPVHAGVIIEVRGEVAVLRTDSGEEIVLQGAPASFRVGQRVWVQGPTSVSVQSYGTVRP